MTNKKPTEETSAEQDGTEQESIQDADVQAQSNGQPVHAEIVDEADEQSVGETGDETSAETSDETSAETDDEAGEPTPEAIIAQLQDELAAAQALAAESVDRMQRASAEFQNTTRRQEKRLIDSIDRANQTLITRLLPALDDFDLAFGNLPAELSEAETAWVSGFQQIRKKLLDALAEEGVSAIDDSGELFDPNRHEAISSEPNDDVESEHIIQTLRTGYEHKGRILRPALVRVAM